MIAPNLILPFDGLNSEIPAGFVRVTDLDGKFPKAWGTEAPNTTGGHPTHSHTSTSHNHTQNSHDHTANLDQCAVYHSGNGGDNTGGGGIREHQHTVATDTTYGGDLATTAATWQSASNDPAYYEVIFIKSLSFASVYAKFLMYFNGVSVPNGWNFCDGSSGTPDLRNKFLKGAATDEDAGGTGGGATHNHDLSHDHVVAPHSHTGTSGQPTNYIRTQTNGGSGVSYFLHSHFVTLAPVTATLNSYVNTTAGSVDIVEPLNKKVGILRNTNGGMVRGFITMMLGTTPPAGWVLCDGQNDTLDLRDSFIKIPNTLADKTDTPAGSNTHTHTPVSHTHIGITHDHTGTSSASGAQISPGVGGGGNYAYADHTHSISSVSSVIATYANADIDASTEDNQPEYLTVAFVEYRYDVGGNCLLNLLT